MPSSAYYVLDQDVTPLKDHVLVINMEQGETLTKSGIIIADDNGKDRGIRPRWAEVYKVGSNIDWIQPGQKILIEHGKWTFGVKVFLNEDGVERELYLQRVDPDSIMLVRDDTPVEI